MLMFAFLSVGRAAGRGGFSRLSCAGFPDLTFARIRAGRATPRG
jgi:hypothetical protein